MPYILKDLVVDRVDLVDEGANSAAFIELYKRKENKDTMDFNEIMEQLKPEHAEVVKSVIAAKDAEIAKAKEDLDAATQTIADKDAEITKANEELAVLKEKPKVCKYCGEPLDEEGKCSKGCKVDKGFDEVETLKSMPEAARELFLKMKSQKEAAEEQVRKAAEEKIEAEAIAKAASLKALPIEQSKLVDIIKGASKEVLDLLTASNAAIEATVLSEIGKSTCNGASTGVSTSEEAWDKLEKKADEIVKRDSVTKEKAMTIALSENPELYREYLNGGAK